MNKRIKESEEERRAREAQSALAERVASALGEAIGDPEGAWFDNSCVRLTPAQVVALLRWAAGSPGSATALSDRIEDGD